MHGFSAFIHYAGAAVAYERRAFTPKAMKIAGKYSLKLL